MKRYPVELFAVLLFVLFLHLGNIPPSHPAWPHPPREVIRSQYRLVVSTIHIVIASGGIRFFGFEPIGTAIGISKRQLLCCAHELEDVSKTSLFADIFDDNGLYVRRIPIKIIKSSLDEDLCILESEEDLPFYVDTSKSVRPKIGDWVYAIGARIGLTPFAISWGSYVSGNFEENEGKIACSVEVFNGNSGGGMYDAEENTLIGVVEGGYSTHRGLAGCAMTYSISINTVKEWLKKEGIKIRN